MLKTSSKLQRTFQLDLSRQRRSATLRTLFSIIERSSEHAKQTRDTLSLHRKVRNASIWHRMWQGWKNLWRWEYFICRSSFNSLDILNLELIIFAIYLSLSFFLPSIWFKRAEICKVIEATSVPSIGSRQLPTVRSNWFWFDLIDHFPIDCSIEQRWRVSSLASTLPSQISV